MTKKTFGNIRKTVETEDKAVLNRFDRADSVLRKSRSQSSVIRDTFSLPPNDYALIDAVRTTASKAGRISTKSEVIRAGLHALRAMNGDELLVTLNKLHHVKPGRKI